MSPAAYDFQVWMWGMTLLAMLGGLAAVVSDRARARRSRRTLPAPQDRAIVGQGHKVWM